MEVCSTVGCIHANLNVEELRYVFFPASQCWRNMRARERDKSGRETRSDIASLAQIGRTLPVTAQKPAESQMEKKREKRERDAI